MLNAGQALMGRGFGTGDNRGEMAANMALFSPLLEDLSINGAKGVLVNITGGPDMTLEDVQSATTTIYAAAGTEANVILGAVIDETISERIFVTVIATGFSRNCSGIPGEPIDMFGVEPKPKPNSRLRKPMPARPIYEKVNDVDYQLEDFKIPAYMRNGKGAAVMNMLGENNS